MSEVQTKPTESQLREVEEGKGLKWLVYKEDGVFVENTPAFVYQRIMESDKPRGGDGASLGEGLFPQTAAQERLRRRREQAKRPEVTEIDDGTDLWYVRSLSLPLYHELALRTPRDEDGRLTLDQGVTYSQFVAAVLFVCLVQGKDDLRPFYEQNATGWVDVLGQVNDSNETETNGLLINACLILNPDILPKATERLQEYMDAQEAIENAVPPLAQMPDSLKPSNESPIFGGEEITPTLSLSELLTVSTSEVPPLDTSGVTTNSSVI